MLRGKSSLFVAIMASAIAVAWSGMGMAADITPETVGTAIANAKTAEDYDAIASYYEGRAKANKDRAAEIKAQYETIHKAKGLRTGSDTEVISTQHTFMKHSTMHYMAQAEDDMKLANEYHKLAKKAGGKAQ
jgi:hypothetical protein